MAYDRYDTRNHPRDDRSRWQDERNEGRGWDRDRSWDRERGSSDDRGFLERAGDQIASWFGDDDDRRPRDASDRDEDRGRFWRDRTWDRGDFEGSEDRFRNRGRDYRPMTGDYGRSEQFFAAGGTPRGRFSDDDRFRRDRSETPWGRDEYRRTSRAGTSDWSDRSRHEDPHYSSWRQRQMAELDRDYEEYRRENQSRFEDDFGNWRQRRQQKRGLLGQIREQMEVVGNDDQHVGTVDRTVSDRIILTKSDSEAGGVHHSLSCSDIDRVEGDRVILDCSAEQAKQRWRDESRSRGLFEREDQGEMGPRVLDRSFEGTYRS